MINFTTPAIWGGPSAPPPYAKTDGYEDTPFYDPTKITIKTPDDFKISDLLKSDETKTDEKVEKPYVVTDGKDDGSIGFMEAAKHLLTGVGNFFKSMVCDENGDFSVGKTLTTLAIAAAVTVGAVAFPVVGTALAVLAVGMGAKDIISAGIDIATAETDKDAALAWQNMGSGLTEEALALTGAKKMGVFDDIANMGGMIKRGEYSELFQHITRFNKPPLDFLNTKEFSDGVAENSTVNATGREQTLRAAYKGAATLGSAIAGMFADE